MKCKILCVIVLFLFFFNIIKAAESSRYFENKTSSRELSYKIDIPLIFSAIGLDLSANAYKNSIKGLSEKQIQNLNKNDIFYLDRFAIDLYNSNLNQVSDYTTYSNLTIPIIISFLVDKENFLSDMAIYGETIYLQLGFVKWCKFLTKRNRPYTYNATIPNYEKETRDARFSFVSLHTSTAFCSAVFISSIYKEKGGKNPTLFCVANLSLATVTGILRIASGEHFLTDIIGGAIIGSAIGYFIPRLHPVRGKGNRITINFTGKALFFSIKV
ncbi:MAG: phosphatase PAP2 family protein [Candidatus Cloacimonetes bacterium]|nr:phosphatase PAP2 family protein [Candidatus Cloacimonadota bacterium]MBL7086131.1 phosphatase PAP2 family protein [Candidatus Cloacimonadota bacterium]